MSDSSLVGRKAPAELVVMAKFKLLKSLIPEKLNKTKIKAVKKEIKYDIKLIIIYNLGESGWYARYEDFNVKEDTDFAYVPYIGKWYLPDTIRQKAFDYHGHKINSGFMYFKNLEIAKAICDQWQYEYLEREKLYDEEKGTSKYEYDEWALMIALSNL